jgi:hypothetical protein
MCAAVVIPAEQHLGERVELELWGSFPGTALEHLDDAAFELSAASGQLLTVETGSVVSTARIWASRRRSYPSAHSSRRTAWRLTRGGSDGARSRRRCRAASRRTTSWSKRMASLVGKWRKMVRRPTSAAAAIWSKVVSAYPLIYEELERCLRDLGSCRLNLLFA